MEQKITDEKLLEMVSDPETLVEIMWILGKMPDFHEVLKVHGEDTLVRLACEAILVKRGEA